MTNEKLGQEPAFPNNPYFEGLKGDKRCFGMSKRLHLAGMAMQGIMTNVDCDDTIHYTAIAEISFNMADELLKQENL
jgi:hypothetical protein